VIDTFSRPRYSRRATFRVPSGAVAAFEPLTKERLGPLLQRWTESSGESPCSKKMNLPPGLGRHAI